MQISSSLLNLTGIFTKLQDRFFALEEVVQNQIIILHLVCFVEKNEEIFSRELSGFCFQDHGR